MKNNLKKLFYFFDKIRLMTQINLAKEINLIVGASKINFSQWILAEQYCLDISKKVDFEKVLGRRKINKLLAEHVLEHLDDVNLQKSFRNINAFLADGGNFRIAVPDGYHSSEDYINCVKPGGTGAGSDDHKHLFTYQTLSKMLAENGFEPKLIEYWDEAGKFHSIYSNDDELGHIRRSYINDSRNSDRNPNYTSLIIDAVKL